MNQNPDQENLTNNHVVSVINGQESARQAARELEAAGYGTPLLLTGEEGARQIDTKGEHSNLFARLLSLMEGHLSDATNFMEQYEEEARNGNYIVALELPNLEAAEAAKEVLDRNGAHNIRFFGKLAVSDLSPQSNPSAPADASPEEQKAI